jgi:iron complex outermembrane receptor protein
MIGIHGKFARSLLLAGLAYGAFTADAAFAQAAPDQQAAAETPTPADTDGAIIVTARRREESLLDVPIAITALSAEKLAQRGALDITSIAQTTPNVTLSPSRATNSTLTAFIRGVGQQDPVSGFEQGVGIYLDDVYLNRPQASVLDIYDVERIEVLRGPQGTLYGRNTVGGAVKYVSRRLPNEFALSLRGTYGSYNQADGVASVSAPIADGLIRVGATVARLTRGGFGTNFTTGLSNYNKDIWAGRGTIELHGSKIFVRVSGDYTHDRSNARGGHRLIPSQLTGTPVLPNVFDTQGGLNSPKQDVEAYGGSIFVEAKPVDGLTLRSITAYRKDNSASPIDFDALPAADVDVPGFYKNYQLSQELQVLVDTGRLHGLIGAYYLNADALTQFDVRLFTTLAGLAAFTNADIRTDTLAGFGDFTYDLTDQFSVSVGGRYTWDQRKAYILRQNYLGGGSPVFGGAGVAFGAPGTNFRGERTYRKFTPRASLTFKPSKDHTLYASFSQGFKGGGFDPRGAGVNTPDYNKDGTVSQDEIAQFLSFAPEQVNSYEIGYKGALLDRRLLVSLAAFHADYTNVQIPGSVACVVGGLPSFCGVVSNAGKARLQGIEAEATAKLARDFATAGDALTLSGSFGYIDAKYKQYITLIGGVPTDVAAFRNFQNTPKYTASATLDYATPIAGGLLDLSTTVSHRSKTYQFEIPNPYLDQNGFTLFDANLVYTAKGGRWSFGVHGKNLGNIKYKVAGYTFLAANATTGALSTKADGTLIPSLGKEGVLTAFYGNPRQVFATATLKF